MCEGGGGSVSFVILCVCAVHLYFNPCFKCLSGRCDGDRVLAILAFLAKEEEEHPRHNLQLGQIVSAQSVL